MTGQSHRLEAQIASGIGSLGLAGKRLLLAVSGGADSVAMLLAFHELARPFDLELCVGTVDHGLRRGSAQDCAFVARLSGRLGIRCDVRRVAVGKAGGTEAAARLARYRALEEIARQRGCEAIATAHTLEDQVETVILRLARGAGTRGLRGILRRRGRVVRPMLDVSRAAVASYLRARKVSVREDPTNASAAFDRNRVRAEVLPALERALGPSALRAFARAADVAREDERYLEAAARRRARSLLRRGAGGEVLCDAGALRELAPALRRRLLRQAASLFELPLTAHQVAKMERALEQPGPARVGLPQGLELTVAYGELRLGRPQANVVEAFEHRIAGPGLYQAGGRKVRVSEARGQARKVSEGAIALDPDRLALPLWLRSRRAGDRFRPRGGHEKKLKAFLIDRKIPRAERDRLPLLCDDAGRVLWIAGVAASDAADEGARARRPWLVTLEASSEGRHALDKVAGRPTRACRLGGKAARKPLDRLSTEGAKRAK